MPTKIDFYRREYEALPYGDGASDDCRHVPQYDV